MTEKNPRICLLWDKYIYLAEPITTFFHDILKMPDADLERISYFSLRDGTFSLLSDAPLVLKGDEPTEANENVLMLVPPSPIVQRQQDDPWTWSQNNIVVNVDVIPCVFRVPLGASTLEAGVLLDQGEEGFLHQQVVLPSPFPRDVKILFESIEMMYAKAMAEK